MDAQETRNEITKIIKSIGDDIDALKKILNYVKTRCEESKQKKQIIDDNKNLGEPDPESNVLFKDLKSVGGFGAECRDGESKKGSLTIPVGIYTLAEPFYSFSGNRDQFMNMLVANADNKEGDVTRKTLETPFPKGIRKMVVPISICMDIYYFSVIASRDLIYADILYLFNRILQEIRRINKIDIEDDKLPRYEGIAEFKKEGYQRLKNPYNIDFYIVTKKNNAKTDAEKNFEPCIELNYPCFL